jgi:nucleoside-diphosphate-sugar epimerase
MKILCTGSTGFVGSHLSLKLSEQGHDVCCLERYVVGRQFEGNNRRVVHADLNDHSTIKEIVTREQPDIVVHLAAISPVAYSYTHWSEVLQTNFTATANLAEVCRINVPDLKQFVFAGTSEEYGQQKEFPIKENADLKPNSPYAVAKVAADKYLRMLYDAYGFPVTIMRPFNTYGRNGNIHFVTERIINQMLNNDNLCLGDPSPIRDFMFIDDHVNGYLRAIGNNAAVNRAFNICSGVGITIEKYVELIGDLIGWKGKVTWGTVPNRPNDITCLIGDNHKIWDILGWKQTVSLETGLKKTIEMLKEKKQNGR